MEKKPVTILIVEDDVIDVQALRRALNNLRVANPVVVAGDGVEALEHLRGENGREKLAPPYLILLDLKHAAHVGA